MSIEALQSFDPFTILDVPSDATMKEIKKQYRKLSLEKHPDKNPDNPLAVQEFIRLTKAYNVGIPNPSQAFLFMMILLFNNHLSGQNQ